MTEQEEWDAIEDSIHCKKDPMSKACEALRLAYYCKYPGSSYNAVRCAGWRRDKVEVKLNATYRRVLAALKKQASEDSHWAKVPHLLVGAQRSWVKFRESQCDLVAELYNGGTLQAALAEDCMAEEAERRIQALKDIARQYKDGR